MKVFDCFMFHNEFEMLDLRLNELKDIVDYFVLIESEFTFQGDRKKLCFNDVKSDYKEFPIIHVVVPFSAADNIIGNEYGTNLMRRAIQEKYTLNGLDSARDDDVIIYSDVDELPKLDTLKRMVNVIENPMTFEQKFYYYFVNCMVKDTIWRGSILCKKRYFIDPGMIRRNREIYSGIPDGGWHFSYHGGPKRVMSKLRSFAYVGYDKKFKSSDNIVNSINNVKDIFGRPEIKLEVVKFDDSFPKYIADHKDKFMIR